MELPPRVYLQHVFSINEFHVVCHTPAYFMLLSAYLEIFHWNILLNW